MNQAFLGNQGPHGANYEVLVGTQNTLPTGELDASATAYNLTNGQLGVLSADGDSTLGFGTFLGASVAATDVGIIKVVQGTPKSNSRNTVSAFGYGDRAILKSDPIPADKIISVSTIKPVLPAYQFALAQGFTAPTTDKNYEYGVIVQSDKRDITHGQEKRNRQSGSDAPPSTATNNLHYWLTKAAYDLNAGKSKYLNGKMPYVVLALDYGGSGGTDIGTLAKNDTVTFMAYKGQDYTFSVTEAFVNGLNKAIATTAGLSTAEIVKIDTATASSGNTIDALLIVSLEEDSAVVFDDTINNFARVEFYTDLTVTTNAVQSGPVSDSGSGSSWQILWDRNVAGRRYSLQKKEMGGYDISTQGPNSSTLLPSYIDSAKRYTATVITYWGEEHTITVSKRKVNKLIILLEAAISDDTADADTGYTVATTNSTLVTNLNNVLGSWLNSAHTTYDKVSFIEEATASAVFV